MIIERNICGCGSPGWVWKHDPLTEPDYGNPFTMPQGDVSVCAFCETVYWPDGSTKPTDIEMRRELLGAEYILAEDESIRIQIMAKMLGAKD
jgi:hypothetical protein